MEKEIKQALSEYQKAKGLLWFKLGKLKNFGDECDCYEAGETIKDIHEGNFDEIFEYCLNCGGITGG